MDINFKNKYEDIRSEFEKELLSFIDSLDAFDERIIEAMKYSLLAGGKRIRPVLMLAVGEMLGLTHAEVMPFAISLECVHTYSLIHDDLPAMDNDVLRRGKPTNHVVFGEDMAILAGDGLLNLAFENILSRITSVSQIKAAKYIAEASGYSGMILGQTIDLATKKEWSEELLIKMHEHKTGKLIKAACLVPSLLCDSKYFREIESYSENLGLLFQITDDILDVESTTEEMGKSVHKDERDKKLTFVSFYGLGKAKEMAKKAELDCIESVKNIENNQFITDFASYVLERKH